MMAIKLLSWNKGTLVTDMLIIASINYVTIRI
jgi:hypothetical protein